MRRARVKKGTGTSSLLTPQEKQILTTLQAEKELEEMQLLERTGIPLRRLKSLIKKLEKKALVLIKNYGGDACGVVLSGMGKQRLALME